MIWTEHHATILSIAFEKLLGKPDSGSIAFVRCLSSEVVEAMAGDLAFVPKSWLVRRVSNTTDVKNRTITADQAVELREDKREPLLLLVDTEGAGAGMDGIYSAAREVDEASLFKAANNEAGNRVKKALSGKDRKLAEQAVKKARGQGQLHSIPPWTEFDFLVRVAAEARSPLELLHLLGMWPIAADGDGAAERLDLSRRFIDQLLGVAAARLTPAQRIASLSMLQPTKDQDAALKTLLREADLMTRKDAMGKLAERKDLWIGPLKVEGSRVAIDRITLVSWRTRAGTLAKWSGLVEDADSEQTDAPRFLLDPDADNTRDYSRLEVRWNAFPEGLEKGSVEYRVAIMTEHDEELAAREMSHSARKVETCRFSNDDFSGLGEDSMISAKVVVSVIGREDVEPQPSEEFLICFGKPDPKEPAGLGKKVRTLSEGVIVLENRESIAELASSTALLPESKGFLVLRTPERGKTFRVSAHPLIRTVEQRWNEEGGRIGRWRIRVRSTGEQAHKPEFVPLDAPSDPAAAVTWERAQSASRRLAERFAARGGCGQIYEKASKAHDEAKDYVLAWTALLDGVKPALALANTIEVQSQSERTVGLIVLPSHPTRVAWHMAYDNLVLHARFELDLSPSEICQELAILDGSMFPVFLPGLESGRSFVFADMLGFHAVGMVADSDKEPKATLALLARALGEGESAAFVPTIGGQSAEVLGDEILKYVECHPSFRILHIHALRAGDGLTVARSLGRLQKHYQSHEDDRDEGNSHEPAPAIVLEFYPSTEQRGIAGRFIAEAREKRRSGAGAAAECDRWMLESISLPGGASLPRLRWARKENVPQSAAHLAIAFDTFESCVTPEISETIKKRPLFAYGLFSFFDRRYSSSPSPAWLSRVLDPNDGVKHPADRNLTDRLTKLHQAVQGCVARNLGNAQGDLVLKTEISLEKADSLRDLHRLCDWVVTLDRNAGVEYFDSPRDNRDIYDAYVIDCVPEREDLGCLQLITSTSNLEEVRRLLDDALDQMGLSHSRRNAEFLMGHLKALSGRLAIRLTGQKAPTSELIALALCHAQCTRAGMTSDCWPSLRNGFLIPVDDVQDLLPPVKSASEDDGEPQPVRAVRPDFIHVSVVPRKGLLFRFIEVKYRRHLRDARGVAALNAIQNQVESLREHWVEWYFADDVAAPFQSVRRAKLARILRFYADKARRHANDDQNEGLGQEAYQSLLAEIDRMIEKGADYSFAEEERGDRGWIFCPDYLGLAPSEISPPEWKTRIFLFGPGQLPDSPLPYARADDEPAPAHPVETRVAAESPPTKLVRTDPPDGFAESGSTSPITDPKIHLGTDLHTDQEVTWSPRLEGNPHLMLVGLPGMGKTTCLLSICGQMIEAGIRPIIFSYHEDVDQRLPRIAPSVRFLDFKGLGFNPLEVIDKQSPQGYLDVAGSLRDIFGAIFRDLGDLQLGGIRDAVKQSFIEKGWDGDDVDLERIREPDFGRFVEILGSKPKQDTGLRSLLVRLDELADYGFFKPTESLLSLWDGEGPLVIRIHKTQNDVAQRAFASLVFYKIYKDMFRRGLQDRIKHAVIFDEAHRAAKLSLIPTMAKECRKYGISLVLASQEARDFHESLFSAIANYLVLRVTEADAKSLVRNVASSDQERQLIDRIKQMDKYRAFYFTEQRRKPCLLALRS